MFFYPPRAGEVLSKFAIIIYEYFIRWLVYYWNEHSNKPDVGYYL
jgi:hypothetical protein